MIFVPLSEVLINSNSSTLRFYIYERNFKSKCLLFSLNQVDLQNMMDPGPDIKRRSHQSKFIKQFCYYTIVFILQTSLTFYSVVTVATTRKDIIMFNTDGRTYNFTPSQVYITLGVGWAAFILALIFNLVYYVLHPSQVSLLLKLI